MQIFRSPYPDVEIPDRPLSHWLIEHAGTYGDRPAFIDVPSGRTMTYRQWADGSRAVAAALAARGFGKGDVLAVFSHNLPEYALAFHGAALAGGVVTTANPLLTAEEMHSQLLDSGAVFLVASPASLAAAREAARDTAVREIFAFAFAFGEGEGEGEGATPFDTLVRHAGTPPDVTIDPAEDLIALPYSSGTTGLPKGVMLTHRNLVANIEQARVGMEFGGEDRLLGLLPFFHIYGMVVVMCCGLRLGSTIVIPPRFEVSTLLQTIEQHRLTFLHVVPPIVLALAKHPDVENHDVSSVRAMCSGAAPLGADLARTCAERIGCSVRQGYGLTELSPVSHAASARCAEEDPGSVGQPVSNTEVVIRDPVSGTDLPAGERGEVCVRGPQVMQGYLNRPDATSAMIDKDGWLHTGDVGYCGEDGRLFIVDRLKELIKYKGCQVAPAELEALLLSHPSIADAAVVGIPDPEAGELPKGFVVLREPLEPQQILEYVAEHVAPYKKLRAVEVIDQIPKSASGKILRRLLARRG